MKYLHILIATVILSGCGLNSDKWILTDKNLEVALSKHNTKEWCLIDRDAAVVKSNYYKKNKKDLVCELNPNYSIGGSAQSLDLANLPP